MVKVSKNEYETFLYKKDWLVEHLRKLGNNEVMPKSVQGGLCLELYYHLSTNTVKVISAIVEDKWPKCSGVPKYPVPFFFDMPKGDDSATKFVQTNNKWIARFYHSKAHKQYVRDRLDLCLWLADRLEEGILDQYCEEETFDEVD